MDDVRWCAPDESVGAETEIALAGAPADGRPFDAASLRLSREARYGEVPDESIERAARDIQAIRARTFVDKFGSETGMTLIAFTTDQKVALLDLCLRELARERGQMAEILDAVLADAVARSDMTDAGRGELGRRFRAALAYWRGPAGHYDEKSRQRLRAAAGRAIDAATSALRLEAEFDADRNKWRVRWVSREVGS